MKPPSFSDLLARPARMLHYPDYEILDELQGHAPGQPKDGGGTWSVSGHTQIFRQPFAPISNADAAKATLCAVADKYIERGVGGNNRGYRTFDGVLRLRDRFGAIPDDCLRLAILRPFEIVHHPAWSPSPEEKARAKEMGLEVFGEAEMWELVIEFGLDVDPRWLKPSEIAP